MNADLNNAADLFGGLGVADDNDDDDFDINEHPRERITKQQLAAAAASKRPALTKDTPLEEHPLFQPTNKQEYEKLRKTVGTSLTRLNEDSSLLYASSLAVDLIRDLSQPLSVENLRESHKHIKCGDQRQRKTRKTSKIKEAGGTATGGAGKKKAKPLARPNVGGGFKRMPLMIWMMVNLMI